MTYVTVYVKVCDGELTSVKVFVDNCHTDIDDISNVQLLLLSANKLPPNQRVVLLNLYEEVTDLLKDKHAEVESVLESVENADAAYQVLLERCTHVPIAISP